MILVKNYEWNIKPYCRKAKKTVTFIQKHVKVNANNRNGRL